MDGTADAQEPGSRLPRLGRPARFPRLRRHRRFGSGCFAEAPRLIDPGIAGNRTGTDVLKARDGGDNHFLINAAIFGHHKRHDPMGNRGVGRGFGQEMLSAY